MSSKTYGGHQVIQ